MKNTTAILGKATILFAAAFFSAAAFAETCPKIEELHIKRLHPAGGGPDSGYYNYWVSDSGWRSAQRVNPSVKSAESYKFKGASLGIYRSPASFIVPGHVAGDDVFCYYALLGAQPTDSEAFIMSKNGDPLAVIAGDLARDINGNWHIRPVRRKAYQCDSDDVNACQFDTISTEFPLVDLKNANTSASPFGQ